VRLDRRAWARVQRALPRGTAWPSVLVLACDLSLVGLAVHCRSPVLLTLALVQLYLLHHECVHHAIFASVRANELLGHLLGFVLFYPFAARREAHLQHHAWTNHPDRDPATARALARLLALSDRQLRTLAIAWRLVVPLFALGERVALGRAFLADRTQRAVAVLYGFGYVALALLLQRCGALGTYLLALYGLLVAEEALNLPHHLHTPFVDRPLPLWEQDAVSHSLRSVPVWSRWILLSFNLHGAHHVFPQQPWYQLRRLDRLLRARAAEDTELSWSLRERRRPFSDAFDNFLSRARRSSPRPQ
jgi:acyl-lipid omega-6 desaturase (Delta-12 desaturase)